MQISLYQLSSSFKKKIKLKCPNRINHKNFKWLHFFTRNEFEECATFIPSNVFTKAFVFVKFFKVEEVPVFLFLVIKLFIFQFLLNSAYSLGEF